VANRGEIAVRVIRSAREMGLRTVAVFSEADERQAHVAIADEAVEIGPPEPSASYLSAERILSAARQTGADAIHPGYGFLSERAEFSKACADAGITFVGPSADAMRKLGSKIEAKQLAVAVGVPVTPGFFEPGASPEQLKRAAEAIGYPVMLKASAGGGGRGMRVAREPSQFDGELSIASDEALKAFGSGEMMVEKLIERPRHIEAQVLADRYGSVACLFERECSIQRRHQKLIEEAPSVVLAAQRNMRADPPSGEPRGRPELWDRMQTAVRSLVAASGYTNAGTVEFMVDEASGEFYFLEVNARLQVEHPVTEMIAGVDLVQWQLRIAAGEALELPEKLLAGNREAISGHAIEVRIVAEDPAAGFLPSVGKILGWSEPKAPGVRVDTGYRAGAEVPRFYDSLLAKLIVRAETRYEALRRLEHALLDFHILGVKTNIAYLLDVIRHPDFRDGRFDTGFLGREFADWQPSQEIPPELLDIAGAAEIARDRDSAVAQTPGVWDLSDAFRVSR
ncbi:MAG TPA: biotin carboxylase N-terminal domain-containing protein, partial [Fimbriimonadaceae bacterium]|nr:biotin carboxylase N-terminal domain-containing protein [Fimbriimonadaceae bacterium]